jgi:hypothetical protein
VERGVGVGHDLIEGLPFGRLKKCVGIRPDRRAEGLSVTVMKKGTIQPASFALARPKELALAIPPH